MNYQKGNNSTAYISPLENNNQTSQRQGQEFKMSRNESKNSNNFTK